MGYLEKLIKNRGGFILYCPECSDYIRQSDPQDFSGGKSVVIDDEPCAKCVEKNKVEIEEAQQIMGRLGSVRPKR